MPKKDKKRTMEIITPTVKIKEAMKCHSTEDAYKIFKYILKYEKYELKDQEHFWIMGIDSNYFVACIYIAAIGSDNRFIIDPVEMFATAINHKSRVIVLAHNHPNQEYIEPSEADINLTNRLYHACKPFGLLVLDHIIISDNNYLSLLRNGNMSEILEMRKYKPYNEIKDDLDKEKRKHGEEKMLEGINKGKREEKIETVNNLLKLNLSIEDIIKVTGFTIDDIEEINKK